MPILYTVVGRDSVVDIATRYEPAGAGIECTSVGSTCTEIGTIERRLAWTLRKDDRHNCEAFRIFGCYKELR